MFSEALNRAVRRKATFEGGLYQFASLAELAGDFWQEIENLQAAGHLLILTGEDQMDAGDAKAALDEQRQRILETGKFFS